MPKSKPTAKEKLHRKKEIKTVVMDKAYGGIAVGETMLVATPLIVDSYIRKIPYGETRTIPDMRAELAADYKCDGTCPMSTSIFIRMSAEAALEDLDAGLDETEIAPFWRVITSKDKMAKKLNLPDPTWLDDRRAMEMG
ncbi:hypothetical protein [Hellea balneolensis]|uniref:hypothetical protein n=1 Tax=Hellea balneolensis TaxID=287478 RepID=UPI000420DD48|nr:hypothetical protein [Hellea balneolensis]